MKEEGEINFQYWKVFGEYWDPDDPISLSSNFAVVLPEVASLLNYRVEKKLILNDITQDSNKVLEDKIKKTFKLHMLEKSFDKSVYKFQSVVDSEQQNGGPKKTPPGRK